MNRICPNCKEKSISVLQLIFTRPRCKNCREKIGHHWFYNVIFQLFELMVVLGLMLFLVDLKLLSWLGLLSYISVIAIMTFIWSLTGPLERKGSILEP